MGLILGCSTPKPVVHPKKKEVITSKPSTPLGEKKEENKKKESYVIGLLMPFNLRQPLDTTEASDLQDRNIRNVAMEFYEGTLIALDSLERSGLECKVLVYDAENDSNQVKKLFFKEGLKSANLLIGPFAGTYVSQVATFANQNKIPLVSPLSNHSIKGKEYLALATPTVQQQVKGMAEYIMSRYKKENIILVNPGSNSDLLFKIYQNVFTEENVKYQDLFMSKANIKALNAVLIPEKTNIIVLPSSNEAFVSELLHGLNTSKNRENTIVVGLPTWQNFEASDFDMIQNLHTLFFDNVSLDRNSAAFKDFAARYFRTFKTEPSVYAVQGFDNMWYWGGLLMKYGKKFWGEVANTRADLIHTTFNFKRNEEGAYENQYVNILQIKDFSLVKLNK